MSGTARGVAPAAPAAPGPGRRAVRAAARDGSGAPGGVARGPDGPVPWREIRLGDQTGRVALAERPGGGLTGDLGGLGLTAGGIALTELTLPADAAAAPASGEPRSDIAPGGGVPAETGDRPAGPALDGAGLSAAGIAPGGMAGSTGMVSGPIEAPFVRGSARFELSGTGTLTGRVTLEAVVDVLGTPLARLTYSEEGWPGARGGAGGAGAGLPVPVVTVDGGTARVVVPAELIRGMLEVDTGTGSVLATAVGLTLPIPALPAGAGLGTEPGGPGETAPPDITGSVGAPLPADPAARLAALLGQAVDALRVHTDEVAARAAERMGVPAFTAGPAPGAVSGLVTGPAPGAVAGVAAGLAPGEAASGVAAMAVPPTTGAGTRPGTAGARPPTSGPVGAEPGTRGAAGAGPGTAGGRPETGGAGPVTDLYFARDAFDPGTVAGLDLLARLVTQALAGLAGPVRPAGELADPSAAGAVRSPPVAFVPPVPPGGEPAPAQAVLDQAARLAAAGGAGPAGAMTGAAGQGAAAGEGAAEAVPGGAGPQGAAADAGGGQAGAEGVPAAAADGAAPGGGAAEPEPAVEVALHIPPAPAAPSPAQQARLGGVTGGVAATGRAAAALPDADATTGEARAAVTEPPEETSARAEAGLAEALGERPAPSPEILQLCDDIRRAIRERRPVDEEHLVEADPQEMAAQAGQSLNTAVEGESTRVAGEYDALQGEPAGTPQQTGQPITPPPAGVPAPGADPAAAAPDPVPAENVSLDADRADLDQRVADSRMERPASEPIQQEPFSTVREGQAELADMAGTRPAEVLAQQDEALTQARAGMAELQSQALASLTAARSGAVGEIGGRQGGMVGTEQQTRESVSRQAQQIFDDAQTRVGALLTPLTQTAMQTWRAGVERHSTQFRQSLDRVARWIEERHSGAGGLIVAGWDALTGLPDWVTDEYDAAEGLFGDNVCALLLEISTDVESVIAAAEAIIEDARQRIDALFDALPAELAEWAAGERAAFAGRLDGLQGQVTAARTGFTRDITREAVTAVAAVQREVEQLRAEAGGLIGRVISAIEEFLDDPVRAIINGLLSILGIPPDAFWALVDRIQQVVSDIADDPRRFGNNLVAALAQGFQQFFDNFGTHLLQGFFTWLFRGLGSVGVTLPTDFSVPSIITFALQLMGLSWGNIREILVRHIGEQNVALIEQAWSLISTLIQRGPAGILEMLRERLDPAMLFDQILQAAVSYVVETLVTQVAVRILGMLNPAGAVLQAIELIYKVLRWVFENAAPMFRLVETVVNGAADILAGNIGGMATAIEIGLAAIIPIVIDLLAGMVGLGDLPERVTDVIKGFQAYVLRIVESIIEWLVRQGRALLSALGLGGGAGQEAQRDQAGDTELGMSITFSAGGESHRHWVQVSGANAELMVASTPGRLEDRLDQWWGEAPTRFSAEPDRATRVRDLITHVRTELNPAEAILEQLEASRQAAERLPARPGGEVQPLPDDPLERQQQIMARLLNTLFEEMGAPGADKLPEIAQHLPGHGEAFRGDVHASWISRQIGVPRIANPDEVPLYAETVLAGTGQRAQAYLGQGSTHEHLLPYFRIGQRERSANTQAFAEYSFRARTPDPPHFVRRSFLQILGDDAAQALRTAGQQVVTPQFDQHIHDEIGRIRYDVAADPYGAFVPFVGARLHPDLVAAVQRAGGVYRFFEGLIRNPTGGPMTWAQFSAIWQTGGPSREHVKNEWRGLTPGTHEWIPVDYIRNVLEHAIDLAGQGDLQRGLGWLDVMHRLRSPTNYVMWSIGEIIAIEYRPDQPPRPIIAPRLGAHVGTASRPGESHRPAGTAGTKYFHDTLREFYRDFRDYGASPRQFVEALVADLNSAANPLLWDGSVEHFSPAQLDLVLGIDINVTGAGWTPGLSLRDVARLQRAQFQAVLRHFQSIAATLP